MALLTEMQQKACRILEYIYCYIYPDKICACIDSCTTAGAMYMQVSSDHYPYASSMDERERCTGNELHARKDIIRTKTRALCSHFVIVLFTHSMTVERGIYRRHTSTEHASTLVTITIVASNKCE